MMFTVAPQMYVLAISGTKGDSVPVIDDETLLFAEAFDGYADKTAAVSAMASEYPNITGTSLGDNNGIAFQGNGSWGGAFDNSKSSPRTVTGNVGTSRKCFAFFTHKDDVVTSGVAHVYFYIQRRNSSFTQQDLRFFSYNGDTSYDYINKTLDFADTSDFNTFPVNTWVYVEAFIDLDNDLYYVTVRNDNTNAVVYAYSAAYTLDNFRGIVVTLTQSSSSSASNTCPLIDDLYIGKLNSALSDDLTAPSGEANGFATNFETVTAGATYSSNTTPPSDGGLNSHNSQGVVPGFSKFGSRRSVRAFSPTYRSGNASRGFEYYLPSANKAEAGSGRYFHIGFYYKPGTYATVENSIKLYPYSSSGFLKMDFSNSTTVLSTADATSIGNNWVYVDLVIDMCEGYMRKTITNAFSGALISFDSVEISNIKNNGFYALRWVCEGASTSWTVTNSPAIDDFTAGELYADEESVYSDAFDKYTDFARLPSNYTVSATDFAYDKEGNGHGNALSANYGKADSGWYIMYFRPDHPLTMGQYHITFDIRPGNTTGTNLTCGGGENNGIGITLIATSGFNVTPKTDWYKADIVYDAARSRASYNVYDSSGNSVKNGSTDFVSSGNYSLSDEMLSFLGWSTSKASSTGSTWSNDNCHAIDNLHIGKYKDYITNFTVNTNSDPVTTSARIHNRGAFNVNQLRVVVAAYNSAGDLIGFSQTNDTSVSSNSSGSLASASLAKPAGAASYKVFLWYRYEKDGVSFYKPLTEPVVTP